MALASCISQAAQRGPDGRRSTGCGVGFEIGGKFGERIELGANGDITGDVEDAAPSGAVIFGEALEPILEWRRIDVSPLSKRCQGRREASVLAPNEHDPGRSQALGDPVHDSRLLLAPEACASG